MALPRSLVLAAPALVLLATGCPMIERPQPDFVGDGGLPIGPDASRGTQPTFGATVEAMRPVPPVSGGTLTVLRDGRTAVAADPDRDRVFVADLREEAVVADLELEAGDQPGRSVEDAAGTVHVVLRGSGALLSLRKTGAFWGTVARRPICRTPRGLAYDIKEDLLHVACADGELVSLPAAGGEPVRTLALPTDLRDVVVSEGNLFVSRFRSAEILRLGRDGTGAIAILGRQTPPSLSGRSRASVAWRMRSVGADGALVVHQNALEGAVQTSSGGYSGAVCAPLMETALSLARADGTTSPVARLPGAVLPVDVAVAPEGRLAAVVAAGNAHTPGAKQVVFVDVGTVGRVGVSQCGSNETAPEVVDANLRQVRQPRGEAVAVGFGEGGAMIVVQTREPAALEILTSERSISLSTVTRADTGHAIFHSTAGSPLACASCHPEGGEDGHVWTFAGLGPRRTQSLRGGVTANAPFHWDGELKTLPQLYTEVFTKRMAGPKLTDQQQRALTRWLETVPALPAAPVDGPGFDDAAVARGRALFESSQVGCASCHGGPALTNNATVDVGTGGAFQVPSLRGVRWRAPYLHSGCAPTLADRFGACGGGDRHGVTSKLSPAQIADLVAYLETL